MQLNSKCSLALHCLLLIAEFAPGERVTSETLARSTGCNAVTIRNLTGVLKKAGILSIARGVGGAALARPAEDISLWDVYSAIDAAFPSPMIPVHPNPSARCPVGKHISPILDQAYQPVEEAVCLSMSRVSLAQLQAHYRELEQQDTPTA